MNYRLIFNTMGKVLVINSILLVIPLIVSVIYLEIAPAWAFLITAFISLAVGGLFVLTCRPKTNVMYAKEGLIIVAFAWIAVSLVGALPFTLSGEIPSYVDAVFEMVSGFTTTGASILTNVESLSYGVHFWRSFSHWIGGMGIIMFLLMLTQFSEGHSLYIMRAEVPGPTVGKIAPKSSSNALILYGIYSGLTIMETILLIFSGMGVFDAVTTAMSTAGTGGFSVPELVAL